MNDAVEDSMHAIIVMGVSGCGKSTIGKALADSLCVPFMDADDFHPAENLKKMQNGIPLTDQDRYPWLNTLAKQLSEHTSTGLVLACSALKKEYRDILKTGNSSVRFIHLKGDFDLIQNRMQKRNHFMPPNLLQSQFDALETPKCAISIDINQDVPTIVAIILDSLNQR